MLTFQPTSLRGIRFSLLLLLPSLMGALAFYGMGENPFLGLLLGLLSAASIVLALVYERIFLYALVGLLPVGEILRVDFLPTTLLIVPGGLAVISLIAAVVLRKRQVLIGHTAIGLAVVLTVWATLSITIVGGLSEARPYWLVFALFFLALNLLTQKEHFLQAVWVFVLSCSAVGFYVFFQRLGIYLASPGMGWEALHNYGVEIGFRNIMGVWLTQGLAFAYFLSRAYAPGSRGRHWAYLTGSACLLGAMATLAIGVYVGLATLVLVIVASQPNTASRLRFSAVGVALIALLMMGPIAERLETQELTQIDQEWGTNRGELWSAGIRATLDHPVLGVGLAPARRSAMMLYIESWFIRSWYANGIVVVPHNMLISVGLETGIPGLVIFLLFLTSVFFSLWRNRTGPLYKKDPILQALGEGLLASLIVGWVQGMGLSTHLDKPMWFLLGFAIAFVIMIGRESAAHPLYNNIGHKG